MAESPRRVLAGDVGGTKTRIGLFDVGPDGARVIHEQSFASAEYGGLDEIVAGFLVGRDVDCRVACFGLAGPVAGRRVRLTNLPWVVDADALECATGIPSVVLINDLEATAWGVPAMGDDALLTLNPGRPGALGNGAVSAAGTGLGEAGIFWNGREKLPFGCEGGHASFSPTDKLGDRLLRFLRDRYETVSWERVLSGPGLADLYRFMLTEAGQPEPDWFIEAERVGDPTPAVSSAGLTGECEVGARTLDVFARLYGEEAGNLALKVMATGGVWVGGGIAPKILPVLQGGAFLDGFLAKGRMRPLLESMPVHVVLDDRAALRGAARRAAIG
ncbi:MAG: glucokinase [Thermoanaerobaculales bacterium]|nr:glucokinase [Thermoanaerobaculales bacterium]